MTHLRLADGRHLVIDNYTTAPAAARNLIYHGMTLQEAVEAPRIWSQGQELEMEQDIPAAIREDVAARGHRVVAVPAVAGGINAVAFNADGTLEGAACLRADGNSHCRVVYTDVFCLSALLLGLKEERGKSCGAGVRF